MTVGHNLSGHNQLGRSSESPSEGCDWTRRRWSVWRLSEGPSKGFWLDERGSLSVWRCVRLVVLPDWSDCTRKETCLIFWDASDWLVWWTCLLETLLICWTDGSVFSVFFWLLCSSCCAISYSHPRLTRKNYAKPSSFGDKYTVLICRWRVKQKKRPSPLFTYSTRGRVTLLCTMPMMWLGKCMMCST